MILRRLSILNYRNIQTATIDLSPKLNCFIGNNGEGKTNILDAVYYLSFCRSAFNPIDAQVMRHDEDFFVLEGDYRSDQGDEEHIYCGMKRGTKKHVKRNKKEYKRLAQHIGLIPLVFVSPADAALIEGGSEERRRLMDVVISQYDHAYMESLMAYNKALQQRNAMLKQGEAADTALLSIWEEQMAAHGTELYQKRTAFVGQLVPVFQEIYSYISGGSERVGLRYVSHGQRGELLDTIQRDRYKDLAVGYSLHGTHRDDLEMLLDGFPMKREGSQGQHKTFALALKLAQYSFLHRQSGEQKPLLLLDDIFDKLDAGRVERIIQFVSGEAFGQIFITDTNRTHLDMILGKGNFDYHLYAVVHGNVTLESHV
ncbi:hypothetical protein HMPREF9431_00289 [Segatella oulorum F0390]|uniref:DNA replication and repair protein RecF n=1 Tax=Segatella oulorum F0390 TaxID=702438 RepID=G1W8Y8_9BACT|nr:DNA replication/repair protein RecF [Segatella oulorum]EGV34576.1 hypothetical protein HMPREF9431_00289 [Segatella oulorum F0390]